MNKIILEMPISITMKFAGGNTANTNIGGFMRAFALLFAPCEADFGGEFGDVFVVFKICPKFDLGTGLFV